MLSYSAKLNIQVYYLVITIERLFPDFFIIYLHKILKEKNRFLMTSIIKIRQESESLNQELTNLKVIHKQSTEEVF